MDYIQIQPREELKAQFVQQTGGRIWITLNHDVSEFIEQDYDLNICCDLDSAMIHQLANSDLETLARLLVVIDQERVAKSLYFDKEVMNIINDIQHKDHQLFIEVIKQMVEQIGYKFYGVL